MKKTINLVIVGFLFITVFTIMGDNPTRGDEEFDNGRIYGYTYQTSGWQTYTTPFVHVEIDGNHRISDLSGYYEINELPINQVLEINAYKFGYETVCISIELTFDKPDREVDIQLVLKDTPQTVPNPLYYFI
jgi:hypothetical protein